MAVRRFWAASRPILLPAMLETGAERRLIARTRPEQRAHPLLRFSLEQVEDIVSKLESL